MNYENISSCNLFVFARYPTCKKETASGCDGVTTRHKMNNYIEIIGVIRGISLLCFPVVTVICTTGRTNNYSLISHNLSNISPLDFFFLILFHILKKKKKRFQNFYDSEINRFNFLSSFFF